MPTIDSMRTFFRRRLRSTKDSFHGTQAERLVTAMGDRFSGRTARDGAATAVAPSTSSARSTSEPIFAPDPTDALTEKLDTIERHFEECARHDTVVRDRLESLPAALGAVPKLEQRMQDLLETLSAHAMAAEQRDDAMRAAIGRLDASSSRQSQTMEKITAQLESTSRTTDELAGAIDNLGTLVGTLAASQTQHQEMLSRMVASLEARETRLGESIERIQKWMVAAVICCGGAAIAAIAGTLATIL